MAINPKYENALYIKGIALDDLGNHTGAIEYYDKALAIEPLNNKGAALNNLGNYTAADRNATKTATNCSQTYLTQQERYNCGYNHGYLDAQRDWNLQRFPPESGGDNSCPYATEHTLEYCNGYQTGYTTSWNALLNQEPSSSGNYTISSAKYS